MPGGRSFGRPRSRFIYVREKFGANAVGSNGPGKCCCHSKAPRYVPIRTLMPVDCAPFVSLTFSSISSLSGVEGVEWAWRFIFSGRSIRFLGGAWLSWQSSEAVQVG